MADLALVMPMAGRGSRFSAKGEGRPKPLIPIAGHPFFRWAVESVTRAVPVRERVFVVLREHVAEHGIDAAIRSYYPDARIVAIAEPTSGAAETAAIGIDALRTPGPIAVNDCDHAFAAPRLAGLADALAAGAAGGLVGFASDNPAYSFVRLDAGDPVRVLATVEKQCVGPYAIAGCYLFRDAQVFARALSAYRDACPYPELFLSGVYNVIIDAGEAVRFAPLSGHLSFGTPEEFAAVSPQQLRRLIGDPAP